MLKTENIKTITELREDPIEIFEKSSKEPAYIFSRSKPVGVVMGVEKFNQLMGMVEDHIDSLELEIAAEATKGSRLVPLNDFWKKNKFAK